MENYHSCEALGLVAAQVHSVVLDVPAFCSLFGLLISGRRIWSHPNHLPAPLFLGYTRGGIARSARFFG